ncbi:hypothetical protein EFK50_05730 [Nocardioides marmoriginsengisoli]|uniref:Uncharacterized protein n=1 Tax=Nocardioides marmoriginsengisoli TaxID=661483 RepID=A0A3N0CQ73_9ACTN|nr:hypothetical protein [Nocardioides marmoriginsengisoli]RNL65451.1 hypothetical protein EFK50_05730 [Nocardioides marmoriginsengisoli]
MSTETPTTPTTRPLSIAHLIFGLIFGGIATLWFIGNANDADFDNQAAGLPVVLIGAGVIGLIAAVLSRRRNTRIQAATGAPVEEFAATEVSAPETDAPEAGTTEPTTPEDTLVLDERKDES